MKTKLTNYQKKKIKEYFKKNYTDQQINSLIRHNNFLDVRRYRRSQGLFWGKGVAGKYNFMAARLGSLDKKVIKKYWCNKYKTNVQVIEPGIAFGA